MAKNSHLKQNIQTAPAKPAEKESQDDSGDQDDQAEQGDQAGQDGQGEQEKKSATGGQGEEGGEGESGGQDGDGEGGHVKHGAAVKKASYKDCVARAGKYTAQKKYAGAAREYNRALAALGDDDVRKVYLYERQGWLALMSNDISGAETFYLAAIYQAEKIETYDKSAVNAYRGAAYCYEKDGEISTAVENYENALKYAKDKGTRLDIKKKLERLKAGKRRKV